MGAPAVALVNRSTVLADADLAAWTAALQTQVSRDFAPAWGIDATLLHVPAGATAPAGAWQLVCLDTTDQAGDLGYHELTSAGLPLGKAFIKTDLSYGLVASVTVSHELLEMLADPFVYLAALIRTQDTPVLVSHEVCDPVEDDQFAYAIEGVQVSDFVLPSYFMQGSGPWDFRSHLAGPAPGLAIGGYIGEHALGPNTAWTQVFGAASPADRARSDRGFHRRRLRATDRRAWRCSADA